jgi:hypothetical protein
VIYEKTNKQYKINIETINKMNKNIKIQQYVYKEHCNEIEIKLVPLIENRKRRQLKYY